VIIWGVWVLTSESNWGSISDIAKINPEITNSNWNGREIRYIDIASVGNGVFNSKPEMMLYDEAPSRARRVVKHGDVLISTVRPNRRSMIQILNPEENTVASTGFALLRPKRIEDSDYLFGIVNNKQFTLEIEMLAYGAAYPAVSPQDICRPSVYLPEESERDRVSKLLRPITTLNQSNYPAVLLEYISTLFRSWFIDFNPVKAKLEGKLPYGMDDETAALFSDSFENTNHGKIPKEWAWGTLLDISRIWTGGTPRTSEATYWDGDIPWVSGADLSSNELFAFDSARTVTSLGVEKSSTKVLPIGTVMITARGTVGATKITAVPMAMSQTSFGFKAKQGISDALVYLASQETIRQLRSFAYGAVFDTFTQSTIKLTKIAIAPPEVLQAFCKIIDPLFEQMKNFAKLRSELEATRDALLPRLMSGEFGV